MRLQLAQDALDHRHGDVAAAGRALPTHLDADRFDRLSRTHGVSVSHRSGSIAEPHLLAKVCCERRLSPQKVRKSSVTGPRSPTLRDSITALRRHFP
jgi:hypothetical protein